MTRFAHLASLCIAACCLLASPALAAPSDSGGQEQAKKDADKKGRKKESKAEPAKTADGKDSSKPLSAKPEAKPAKPEPKKEASTKAESKPGEVKKEPAAKDAKKDEKAAEKPTTYKVKKKPFKIEVTLDGTFEAQNMADVAMHCREWSDFEVLKAVEHGTKVSQGDLLIALDSEKIDKAIADLEREQTLSQIALHEAELQLKALAATVPLDLASNQRSKRLVDEDLAYFEKVDRPMSERMANFMVKLAEQYLSYEQEELKQLEKMYKADDLVEETEEIILKRARDTVERAKFTVERMKTMRDEMLKMSLPRAKELLQQHAERQAIDSGKAKVTIPMALRRAELALERLQIESRRSEDKLKRLKADRGQMILKAPMSGVAYYGRWTRGKWSSMESAAEKLRRGGRLMNDDVVLTVVESRPLFIHTTVSEKQLPNVRAGLKATALPAALPDLRLTAIVERVGQVPNSSKEFDTRLTVSLDDEARSLMPGMTCDVKLVPYQKSDALVVPAAALGPDEIDSGKYYVSVVDKGGKQQKREVTRGKHTEKLVEIVKGLTEGDEILAEYPKPKD